MDLPLSSASGSWAESAIYAMTDFALGGERR
jgi:hypothetical protein